MRQPLFHCYDYFTSTSSLFSTVLIYSRLDLKNKPSIRLSATCLLHSTRSTARRATKFSQTTPSQRCPKLPKRLTAVVRMPR